MSSIREFWDSLGDNLRSRFANPFAGAFVLTWLVVNWRYVYVAFFLESTELPYHDVERHTRYPDKFTYMDEGLQHGLYEFLWHPMQLAVVITITLPLAGAVSSLLVDGIRQGYRRVDSWMFKKKYFERAEVDGLKKTIESLEAHNQALRTENTSLREDRLQLMQGEVLPTTGPNERVHAVAETPDTSVALLKTLERRLTSLVVQSVSKHQVDWRAAKAILGEDGVLAALRLAIGVPEADLQIAVRMHMRFGPPYTFALVTILSVPPLDKVEARRRLEPERSAVWRKLRDMKAGRVPDHLVIDDSSGSNGGEGPAPAVLAFPLKIVARGEVPGTNLAGLLEVSSSQSGVFSGLSDAVLGSMKRMAESLMTLLAVEHDDGMVESVR